ncbi:hypothetical protein PENTCL1PPCAC_12169, partial [Pristionchus entomophagus]
SSVPPLPYSSMALRFLVAIMASAAVASVIDRSRNSFHLEPEVVLSRYEAGPLECYNWNNVTGGTEIEVCHREGGHSLAYVRYRNKRVVIQNINHPIAAYPACLIAQINLKDKTVTKQLCVYLPSIAVLDCEKSLCLENVRNNGRHSSCCCTTSRCNGHMLRRPQPVLELPDEE